MFILVNCNREEEVKEMSENEWDELRKAGMFPLPADAIMVIPDEEDDDD